MANVEERNDENTLDKCPSNTEQVGRADICKGCPGREYCLQNASVDSDQKFIDVRMNAIKHKLIIMSAKGGVGKSTVVSCLAITLAKRGHKVGVADLDLCGPSIPLLLGVRNEKVVNSDYGWKPAISPYFGIKVMSSQSLLDSSDSAVVWRGPRKTNLVKSFAKDVFWGRLDYLLFDLPPGTSDEHLTCAKVLQSAKIDGVLLVTTPHKIGIDTMCKCVDFCKKVNLPILGLIENMSGYVCSCCGQVTDIYTDGGAGEVLERDMGVRRIGKLPMEPGIARLGEEGEEVGDYVEKIVSYFEKITNFL